MQHNFQLEEWVKRCYCPVVMCATTPSVEEICSKNNLNFVQLLQPFSQLDNIRIYPYKLESGQSIPPKQITSLSLRFVSTYEISSISQEASDIYLAEYCRKLAPNAPIQLTHLRNHKKQKSQQQQQDKQGEGGGGGGGESKESKETELNINNALRICSVSDVDNFFVSNPDPTPWFSLYQKQFLSTLRFNDYEFLDAPIAIMYVASTRDDDPVAKLKKLSSKSNLAIKFKNGIYSSDMHKVFILLHDKHDIDLRSRVQFLFQNVCKSFDGNSCKLLHINSNSFTQANYDNIDLWEHFDIDNNDNAAYPLPKSIIENYNNIHCKRSWSKAKNYYINNKTTKHAIYLSDQDISVLTQFVSDFCIYGIMPFIEKKISTLYQSISKQRRGTINTFKKWIQSNNKDTNSHNNNNDYQLHTIQSQIRQLADLSFVFQQYHLSLDHYKLCQTDYENDAYFAKSYLCGCLEMSGLCCALLSNAISTPSWMKHNNQKNENKNKNTVHHQSGNQSGNQNQNQNNNVVGSNGHGHIPYLIDRRDMEKYYDQSFRGYCEINNIRLATRTCIWAWLSHCSLGHSFNNDMISNVLLRPSEKETKHRSAMLLEQAAFAYLRAGQDRSPCIRKYAFHLILAAHLYKECEQKQHSIRCYSRAMMVYAERGWCHIEDHINYNLGYLSSKVLRYNPAIQYFLELLGEGRGSATRQKNFLDKFISIISKWPNTNQNNSSLLVNDIGILCSQSISKTLKFVPNLNIPKFNANEILIILNDPNLQPRDYCIVGEPIIVQFPIYNPLKRELIVNNLCLHISVSDVDVDTNTNIDISVIGYDDLFEYQAATITLLASETKLFSLSIIPKNNILCGYNIKIVGIRWQIFDCMQGFYKFENAFKESKLCSALSIATFLKSGKKSIATFQKDHRSIHYYLNDIDNKMNLVYNVQQPIAFIKCSASDLLPFPSAIYCGELCPFIMELHNASHDITAYNIELEINKPSFLTIVNIKTHQLYSHNTENNVINFNQNIAPNKSLKLLIWIYGSQTGRHLIQFYFNYTTKDKLLRRTTIICRYLTVNPFMNISLFTKDHFGDINQHILGIEIENNFINNTLINRGCATDIKYIQLKDMSQEEKNNVFIPQSAQEKEEKNNNNNIVQIQYIGCYSSSWSIQKLIYDNIIPDIHPMSTLTTFLKLVADTGKNNNLSVVSFDSNSDSFVSESESESDIFNILNPMNQVCQNMFKLKQKEHENRLRHIARVFRHIRQKHKNELEIIVSFKIKERDTKRETERSTERERETSTDNGYLRGRYGYLLLREPFVFARHETLSNCPLRVALKYPKKLPISSKLPIDCNVTLMVLNTGSKYVTFILETLKQNEEFDSHQRSFIINDNPSTRSKYQWIGNTKFENQILEPGGYSSYDLISQFKKAGIYNLNRYRFIVQIHSNHINSIKKTNPSKIFFFPTQHLIVVGARNH